MKKALICGISGQDGAYLARLLLEKGYQVFGASRDAQINAFDNLVTLGIREEIELISVNLTDFRSVWTALRKVDPDEIYNLAGLTSVGLSFEQPVEAMESISGGTLNLLEAIRISASSSRLYCAGSGECFGDTQGAAADESTPFHPRSPYAVAKSAAYWQTVNYRNAYGIHACTGILFNHESALRPARFVTRKIVKAACRIAKGEQDKLLLGDISARRDWGWAPEYVHAMWLMLQRDHADDYVIATGQNNSVEEFAIAVFGLLDMDFHDFAVSDPNLYRPADIAANMGNPQKAAEQLGWVPETKMEGLAKKMVDAELGKTEI
jgi:GDPmannose 4,6-dehydratase